MIDRESIVVSKASQALKEKVEKPEIKVSRSVEAPVQQLNHLMQEMTQYRTYLEEIVAHVPSPRPNTPRLRGKDLNLRMNRLVWKKYNP